MRCIFLSYSLSLLIFIWVSLFFDMFMVKGLVTIARDHGSFSWLVYLLLGAFIINGTFDYICLGVTRRLLKSKLYWSGVIVFDLFIKIISLWALLYCLNSIFTGVSVYNGLTYFFSIDETPEGKAEFFYALMVFWTTFREMLFGWNITNFSV